MQKFHIRFYLDHAHTYNLALLNLSFLMFEELMSVNGEVMILSGAHVLFEYYIPPYDSV